MEFIMDLQLFGGGGESSTTSREIPDQTANEQALENFLMNGSSLGGNMAPYAYQAFAGSLNDVFTPNYNSLYNEYVNRTDNNQQAYTDYLTKALDDYNNATNTYWSLMDSVNREFQGNTDSLLGEYNKRMDNYLEDYTGSMGNAQSAYDTAVGKRSSAWDDLVNGVLPSQYATNRQAALNADLKGTMGSAINNLASRGVINSGVGNKAMDDISQSASDTLAKRYADDLQLEASLLGQDRANAKTDYDVATNTAGNVYGNQSNNANSQFSSFMQGNQAKYTNNADTYNNVMNQYGNMYKEKANQANNWIGNTMQGNDSLYNGAISGQTASLQVPSQYLSYAQSLSQPVENLYNTMYSGRMGTGSTTTTQSDGGAGIWSAVGGLGSAAIMACFTGDTLVTTPDGYKQIANIQEGDTVLSVHDGKVVPKRVVRTYGPNVSEVIEVRFENGTVWHTTKTQRYFDGKHFGYVDYGITPAMVYQGNDSQIVSVKGKGDVANVYDLKLEGFAGENVFFANDVAAEGFGD